MPERSAQRRLARRLPADGRGPAGAVRGASAGSRRAPSTTGVGEGGDRRLVIDRRAEDVVFAELERCTAEGHGSPRSPRSAARSRSATRREPLGSSSTRSTARSTPAGCCPPHALSVAVASGPTMADVEFGFVYDFGAGEEFSARRGEGARRERRAAASPRGPATASRSSGSRRRSPERIVPMLRELEGRAYRIRVRRLDRDLALHTSPRAASTGCSPAATAARSTPRRRS